MEIHLHYTSYCILYKFKIDLIVWKYSFNLVRKELANRFKIDLIVWKFSHSCNIVTIPLGLK